MFAHPHDVDNLIRLGVLILICLPVAGIVWYALHLASIVDGTDKK